MIVAVTGTSGFLGRALSRHLRAAGVTVVPVYRDPGRLPNVDAVVHLAGESIGGRWTPRRRRAILESRVGGTRRLVDRMEGMGDRPRVLLCASGTGIYGDRPGETLTEESSPGNGFRTEVCLAWEAEARRAAALGVRTAMLRFGAILHPAGGLLGRLLPWHRRGICFVLGDASAPVPWIGREDAVRLIEFCLDKPLEGPVNAISPEPTTQEELARLLAASQGRRLSGRFPRWALRLALGELARAVTDRQHVVPFKALRHGFSFRQDLLSACLDGSGGDSSPRDEAGLILRS